MGRRKTKILTFYTMFIKYYSIFSKYNNCYKFFLCISPEMCCSLYIVKFEIRNFKVIKLSRNYTYYNVNILSFIIKLCFYSMFFIEYHTTKQTMKKTDYNFMTNICPFKKIKLHHIQKNVYIFISIII